MLRVMSAWVPTVHWCHQGFPGPQHKGRGGRGDGHVIFGGGGDHSWQGLILYRGGDGSKLVVLGKLLHLRGRGAEGNQRLDEGSKGVISVLKMNPQAWCSATGGQLGV